jgi:hypothetical protein
VLKSLHPNSPLQIPFWGILIFIFFVGMSAYSEGCRSKKITTTAAKPATSAKSPEFLLKTLQSGKSVKVASLTAKTAILASGDRGNISATANIIWLKDSVLWINVKKFGIEAARALITRDSVFVLNRLEKTYSAAGLNALQQQYSLPGGFALLQDFLLGNAWFFPDIRLTSGIQDSLHHLYGENRDYGAEYFIEEGSYRLRRENFLQRMDNRQVLFSFQDFRTMPEYPWFAFRRSLMADSPETGKVQVDMEFENVTFNSDPAPVYKFEIPAHYRRVEGGK